MTGQRLQVGMAIAPVFGPWLERWQLAADGAAMGRNASLLLPVRMADGRPAMLKHMRDAQEQCGARLLAWWQGHGAVASYAQEGVMLLMERVPGPSALECWQAGDAAQATAAVCTVAQRLHAHQPPWPDALPLLPSWFADLLQWRMGGAWSAADRATVQRCTVLAQTLLAQPDEGLPLHGDLHHGNAMRSADGGWKAIDPKGVVGERGFELAALLCNPELPQAVLVDAAQLLQRSAQVAQLAHVPQQRLLQWTAARAALSAAWFAQDGEAADALAQLQCAETALRVLPAFSGTSIND